VCTCGAPSLLLSPQGAAACASGLCQQPQGARWVACLQGSRSPVQAWRHAHTQRHVRVLFSRHRRQTHDKGPCVAPPARGRGLTGRVRARGAGGPARARAAAGAHAAVQLQRDGRAALEARHHRVRGRAAHRALAADRGAGARPALFCAMAERFQSAPQPRALQAGLAALRCPAPRGSAAPPRPAVQRRGAGAGELTLEGMTVTPVSAPPRRWRSWRAT